MGRERSVYSPVLTTPTVYKAVGEDTATAVLTYPVYDAEGEWVQPDGGDWSAYPLSPKVDWHHGTPVGRGEVTLKAITDEKGVSWVVPVGTTRFFRDAADLDGIDRRVPDPRTGAPTNKPYSVEECLSRAAQARFLVCNDHATGVSVEFEPVERAVIGPSLLKAGRPAFRHTRWKGLGWAHTYGGDQINPGAQTVLKAANPATLDLIRGGKLPDGTPLDPVIRKAFDGLLTANPRPALVVGGFTAGVTKAMDYEPGPDDVPPPDEAPDAEQSDTPDEAAVPTDLAQLFMDAADRLQAVADKSLHKPSNKYLAKYAEEARALAEDLMAHADSVGDELASRKKNPDESEPDGDEDGDGVPDDDEDDKEEKAWPRVPARPLKESLSAAGVLVCKAFQYVPRVRLADLKPVGKAAEAPPARPAPPRRSHALTRAESRLDRLLN